MLRQYNDVSPGRGDRILDEWLDTVAAERSIAVNESAAVISQATNGQKIAACLAIACVIAAIVFGLLGEIVQMSIILSAPLLLLIGQFIQRRRS